MATSIDQKNVSAFTPYLNLSASFRSSLIFLEFEDASKTLSDPVFSKMVNAHYVDKLVSDLSSEVVGKFYADEFSRITPEKIIKIIDFFEEKNLETCMSRLIRAALYLRMGDKVNVGKYLPAICQNRKDDHSDLFLLNDLCERLRTDKELVNLLMPLLNEAKQFLNKKNLNPFALVDLPKKV